MLGTAPGTQALLDLEDRSPDVLFEHVDGSPIPVWPQIRNPVSLALDEFDYQIRPVSGPEVTWRRAASLLGRSFLPSRWDAAFARRRTPLCFLVGGNTVHRVGERERNWLIGDYVERNAELSTVLQWGPLPSRLGPPSFSATWSLRPLATRSAGFGRLSRRNPEPRVRVIVGEVVRQLDIPLSEDQVAAIVSGAVFYERMRPYVDRGVARVLDRLDPSVVLMEDASYGTRASLIAMMKGRGIVVAEPQHGWIGPTHAAYNFGSAMFREPLRNTLPDELLTFGAYWGRGLRYPGRITTIGKPNLEAAAAEPVPVAERAEVLVVSSSADPDEMSRFVLSLRGKLDPGWVLAFRPHPAERKVLSERYPRLVSVEGIRIDSRDDVYDSLGAAAVVIGVASTVLFEAPAFGCRVFVRNSPQIDYYVGDRFGPAIKSDSDLSKVADRINARDFSEEHRSEAACEMWASGASERFQAWVAGVLRP